MPRYVPGSPPVDPSQLGNWLIQELGNLSQALNEGIEEWNTAPDNPYNGQLAIADGTNWNPGSGRGVYWYDESGSTWNKL